MDSTKKVLMVRLIAVVSALDECEGKQMPRSAVYLVLSHDIEATNEVIGLGVFLKLFTATSQVITLTERGEKAAEIIKKEVC